VFDLPSSGRFRRELLPESKDAEAPAPDIPLYPGAECRTQVGKGTSCFVGFYLTTDSLETVRAFYVGRMGRLGWRRITAEACGQLETYTKHGPDRAVADGNPLPQSAGRGAVSQGRVVVVHLKRQDSATTRIGLVATAADRRQLTAGGRLDERGSRRYGRTSQE